MQAALQQAALMRTVVNAGEARLKAIETSEGVCRFEKINLLVRKVQRRFGQRTQFSQLVEERVNFARKVAMQRANGTPGSGSCRGVDQIGNRLGLRQIQLSIEEGAPGKFAGFGQSPTQVQTTGEQ